MALTATPTTAKSYGPAEIHIQINIPAYRLYLLQGDEVIAEYPVAVGAPDSPTPTRRWQARGAMWNPWWYPPDSPWAVGKHRAPPGAPYNPMGRLKIPLDDGYLIHGTNLPNSIGNAVSKGCIRMLNEDIIELAQLIMATFDNPISPRALADYIEHPKESSWMEFPWLLPVDIVYHPVVVDDMRLIIHPDVYQQGIRPHLEAALAELGILPDQIDRQRLAKLLHEARWQVTVIEISRLLIPETAPTP